MGSPLLGYQASCKELLTVYGPVGLDDKKGFNWSRAYLTETVELLSSGHHDASRQKLSLTWLTVEALAWSCSSNAQFWASVGCRWWQRLRNLEPRSDVRSAVSFSHMCGTVGRSLAMLPQPQADVFLV